MVKRSIEEIRTKITIQFAKRKLKNASRTLSKRMIEQFKRCRSRNIGI